MPPILVDHAVGNDLPPLHEHPHHPTAKAPTATKSARKSDTAANLGFEAKLWAAADALRNNMDAAEYKHVVLGLIFLKYISVRWEGREPIGLLKSLINRHVVCEGKGVFRPSGSLLRIDADAIEAASTMDFAIARLPTAVANLKRSRPVRVKSGEPSPYAAFIGGVPAEESDEEFSAAVEALS